MESIFMLYLFQASVDCFAEFTLSKANVLAMTVLRLHRITRLHPGIESAEQGVDICITVL